MKWKRVVQFLVCYENKYSFIYSWLECYSKRSIARDPLFLHSYRQLTIDLSVSSSASNSLPVISYRCFIFQNNDNLDLDMTGCSGIYITWRRLSSSFILRAGVEFCRYTRKDFKAIVYTFIFSMQIKSCSICRSSTQDLYFCVLFMYRFPGLQLQIIIYIQMLGRCARHREKRIMLLIASAGICV